MTVRNRFNNPVLQKEFKLRFRTVKSFVGLFMYLLIFGILALGFIYVLTLNQTYLFFQPEESRALFSYLAIIQLVMLLFITPGLTAGVVSGERERQTLNILLTTTLSSFQIIVGKLLSSVAYLLLLLLASLPLFSFVFLFGGVAPEEILLCLFHELDYRFNLRCNRNLLFHFIKANNCGGNLQLCSHFIFDHRNRYFILHIDRNQPRSQSRWNTAYLLFFNDVKSRFRTFNCPEH